MPVLCANCDRFFSLRTKWRCIYLRRCSFRFLSPSALLINQMTVVAWQIFFEVLFFLSPGVVDGIFSGFPVSGFCPSLVYRFISWQWTKRDWTLRSIAKRGEEQAIKTFQTSFGAFLRQKNVHILRNNIRKNKKSRYASGTRMHSHRGNNFVMSTRMEKCLT